MEMQALSQLASTGVVGVLLVLTLLALRSKDRELRAESQARIEDAKKYNDLAMNLQKQMIESVNKQGEIMDRFEAIEEQRRAAAQERGRRP